MAVLLPCGIGLLPIEHRLSPNWCGIPVGMTTHKHQGNIITNLGNHIGLPLQVVLLDFAVECSFADAEDFHGLFAVFRADDRLLHSHTLLHYRKHKIDRICLIFFLTSLKKHINIVSWFTDDEQDCGLSRIVCSYFEKGHAMREKFVSLFSKGS